MRNKIFFAAFLVLFIIFESCTSSLDKITVKIKDIPFTVEVAKTDAEREKGLMYRKNLAPKTGMLFVFNKDQHLSFWMKNTLIPLSIAFLSRDGKILEIEDMNPESERVIRSIYSSRFALEVNRGEFNLIGAHVGDFVEFPKEF